MTGPILGALIGAIAGTGFWLLAVAWTRRRITLEDRVAPYVRHQSRSSRLLAVEAHTSFPMLRRILAPIMADTSGWIEKLGSGSSSVARRLGQAGRPVSVEQFRVEQVVWGAAGLAAGLLVGIALAARGAPLILALLAALIGGLIGVLGRDEELSRAAKRRQRQIVEELPDVAELVALGVAAGATPAAAIERVAHVSSGVLGAELRDLMADVRTGSGFTGALERLASGTASPELARFADAIAVATDRGTPLAEVMRAQAVDLRQNARQRLMEVGGTKEISMMVPVVFLVLPVTVLFALFPGLSVLQVGL